VYSFLYYCEFDLDLTRFVVFFFSFLFSFFPFSFLEGWLVAPLKLKVRGKLLDSDGVVKGLVAQEGLDGQVLGTDGQRAIERPDVLHPSLRGNKLHNLPKDGLVACLESQHMPPELDLAVGLGGDVVHRVHPADLLM